MVEMEQRDPTLCDCTIEVAELFASIPAAGIDDGFLLDLLSVRLEASRVRLTRPHPRARDDTSSERKALC